MNSVRSQPGQIHFDPAKPLPVMNAPLLKRLKLPTSLSPEHAPGAGLGHTGKASGWAARTSTSYYPASSAWAPVQAAITRPSFAQVQAAELLHRQQGIRY